MGYTDNYKKIVNAYLKAESIVSKERLLEIHELAHKMCHVSSRHHYIPQYFIKGFASADKQLFVYDKVLDKIKRKKSGSKGLFYIESLNTINFDESFQASFIEDDYFKMVDDSLCKTMSILKHTSITEKFLTPELHAQVSIFIADLFWRNPISDSTFESVFRDNHMYSKIKNRILPDSNLDTSNPVNTASFKKLFRSSMGLHTIKSILEERKEDNWQAELLHFDEEIFVIGDYPFLLMKQPENLSGLFNVPSYLPISSHRVYRSNVNRSKNIDKVEAYWINALIINQSQFLVGSANMEVLEKSILIYKRLKEYGHFSYLLESLFN